MTNLEFDVLAVKLKKAGEMLREISKLEQFMEVLREVPIPKNGSCDSSITIQVKGKPPIIWPITRDIQDVTLGQLKMRCMELQRKFMSL